MSEEEIESLLSQLGLAMSKADLLHTQRYFRDTEHRDPTITEIRVLDTYWSDHCRHTTFATVIENVQIESSPLTEPIRQSYEAYLQGREKLGRTEKPECLMDIALMAMRELKAAGKLTDQEESDEINACSIVVPVDVNGQEEEWLLMFKNETHNHPTEIEPLRRSRHLSGRRHSRSAERTSLCVSGYAYYRRCGSHSTGQRYHSR